MKGFKKEGRLEASMKKCSSLHTRREMGGGEKVKESSRAAGKTSGGRLEEGS
jgi:hypothetical protein